MKKLNFGCGSIQPDDWDNVEKDLSFAPAKDPGNFYSSTKHFPDDTYDIIVAHAVIQQFDWHKMIEELEELRRILKPNGILRISLPDIVKGFEAYNREKHDQYADDYNGEAMTESFFPNKDDDIEMRFSSWLTWYSTSKTLLTEYAAKQFLWKAGFREVFSAEFKKSGIFNDDRGQTDLDSRENEFFFLEAKK